MNTVSLVCCWTLCVMLISPGEFALAGLRPKILHSPAGITVDIWDEKYPIFSALRQGSSLIVIRPGRRQVVTHKQVKERNGTLNLEGGNVGGLSMTENYRNITPDLIERTVTVVAHSDQRYYLDFGWKATQPGEFYSFIGKEELTKQYSPSCDGPEFENNSKQTFPFLGYRVGNTLYGLVGDSPGIWENRSFMRFDLENRVLSLANGDGSHKRVIRIPEKLDATSVYRATFDGWQHIEAGERHQWKTWLFSSPVEGLYDIQLAAHLALANAKGFNHSGLEAILRNTAYLLLRRNLLRTESNYIFISGVGYGWKQWVTDGFYLSRALDDPQIGAESLGAVFYDRINYEDNAHYYLIWSLLTKRAGGSLDTRTLERAYQFIRKHEVDGLYLPPRLKPELKSFRTYHDLLPYEDGDAPSSNQGFHCGALMAAKELGFQVTDQQIEKAIAEYGRMFNQEGKYMPTSSQQQEHIGQDSLYGEVLTFVVFGKKLLSDEMVRSHLETTMRIQSPYGMRVISKANGDLLDGHSGVYVFGGSWFLNDAANYLAGLIHGMDYKWVDEHLLWRLRKELAFMPAFHESISTVNGKPHGHHLYSWNSGYWWLRREIRKRLNIQIPDQVESELDRDLGVVHQDGFLVLDPSKATLRPTSLKGSSGEILSSSTRSPSASSRSSRAN